MIHQETGSVCEANTTALPFQELLASFRFQLAQLLRHRRSGEVESVGGSAEGAVSGDGLEGPEALQIKHIRKSTVKL